MKPGPLTGRKAAPKPPSISPRLEPSLLAQEVIRADGLREELVALAALKADLELELDGQALALDADGALYIADQENKRVRCLYGGAVTTLAGSGADARLDGVGVDASFSLPSSLHVCARSRRAGGGPEPAAEGEGDAGGHADLRP